MGTSNGMRHVLPHGDPMLDKIDLAYALNAHMAQGVTSDHGIAVMDSRETRLANLRLALVTATRVRDTFFVVADDPQRLVRQLGTNRGDKTSALETIGGVPAVAPRFVEPSVARARTPQPGADWDSKAADAVDAAANGLAKPELEKELTTARRERVVSSSTSRYRVAVAGGVVTSKRRGRIVWAGLGFDERG